MPEGFALVPQNTGMSIWGKVWEYGSKLHDENGRRWISFGIFLRQPGNVYMITYVNWMDFTWVPEKRDLVICQGVPILKIGGDGSPYLVLRSYGSKGVRRAHNQNL